MFNAVITTAFADLLDTAAGMCQKKLCLVDPAVDHFINTGGMKKLFIKFLEGTGTEVDNRCHLFQCPRLFRALID